MSQMWWNTAIQQVNPSASFGSRLTEHRSKKVTFEYFYSKNRPDKAGGYLAV